MPRHIGIVACSAEGAALCYRTICLEAEGRMGEYAHPQVTMSGVSLAEYMDPLDREDWNAVAELMSDSARRLARAGAEFAICPDNTIHQAFEQASRDSPIPWLHIVDAVAARAQQLGLRRLGITGTRFLMDGPVYAHRLAAAGIEAVVPEADDRARIDAIIFQQLVKGRFADASRAFFNSVFERLAARGCDGVVLGCTEIPLLVRPEESPLPTLDSTRLLARAALEYALGA